MKQALLDKRISRFIKRKSEQFPDLDRSVTDITRELEAQERARHIIHLEEKSWGSSLGFRYAS